MNRQYILDKLHEIVYNIYGLPIPLSMRDHLESCFGDSYSEFVYEVERAFGIDDPTLLQTAETVFELVVLLEDEIF